MLHEYGNLVKKVEGEMASERDRQANDLEDRLKKRRE